MESIFRAWKTSRELHAAFIDRHTIDQLNKIPSGFNNNIIWNIGHITVAQQSLIYKSSDLEMHISDVLFQRYKPGTKPLGPVVEEEVSEIKNLLTSLIELTENDFYDGKFTVFHERKTLTGFYLGSLKDAFEFNNYHEGIHLGYMMSIRKFL
jgi:hypothetical protein